MRALATCGAAAGRLGAAPGARPTGDASRASLGGPAALPALASAAMPGRVLLVSARAALAETAVVARGFASSRTAARGDTPGERRRRRERRKDGRAQPAGRRGDGRAGAGRPAPRAPPPAPKLAVAVYASWDGSGRRPAAAGALTADARRAVEAALRRRGAPAGEYGISLSVCDDPSIRELNREWREVDRATDVLSVSMLDDGEMRSLFGHRAVVGGLEAAPRPAAEQSRRGPPRRSSTSFPVCTTLGELAVSLDTASRQAVARGTSLRDECRVLLVHGVLHLLGYDHELGEAAREAQALEERAVLRDLGWSGVGLVLRSEEEAEEEEEEKEEKSDGSGGGQEVASAGRERGGGAVQAAAERARGSMQGSEIADPCLKAPSTPALADAASLPPVPADVASAARAVLARRPGSSASPSGSPTVSQRQRLLAIDMDGTLLASDNRVPASAALALRLVAASGVTVVLATGKAPYAAREALRGTGLDAATSGDGTLGLQPPLSGEDALAAPVVDTSRGPGTYVQGALVLGHGGAPLAGAATLSAGAVRATLEAAGDPERVLGVAGEEAPAAEAVPRGPARGGEGGAGASASAGAPRTPLTAVAFMSDGSCAALEATPRVRELHVRYNEPDPAIVGTPERMGCGAEGGGSGAPLAGASMPPPLRALKMVVLLPRGTRGHAARHGPDATAASAPPLSSAAPSLPLPEAVLGSLVAPFGARITVAVPGFLEVVPCGVDKWKALCRLAEELKIDPRDVVCVGDGMNDLEMLQGAGIGIALGGSKAPPALREAADVVAPSADEDGLAIALRAVFLQDE